MRIWLFCDICRFNFIFFEKTLNLKKHKFISCNCIRIILNMLNKNSWNNFWKFDFSEPKAHIETIFTFSFAAICEGESISLNGKYKKYCNITSIANTQLHLWLMLMVLEYPLGTMDETDYKDKDYCILWLCNVYTDSDKAFPEYTLCIIVLLYLRLRYSIGIYEVWRWGKCRPCPV